MRVINKETTKEHSGRFFSLLTTNISKQKLVEGPLLRVERIKQKNFTHYSYVSVVSPISL